MNLEESLYWALYGLIARRGEAMMFQLSWSFPTEYPQFKNVRIRRINNTANTWDLLPVLRDLIRDGLVERLDTRNQIFPIYRLKN